jgi:multiple sugar transport system permease protein
MISRQRLRGLGTALALLAPYLLIAAVFQLAPVLDMLSTSVYRFNLFTPDRSRFVGFDNYARLTHDPAFTGSMKVSLVFMIAILVLQLPLGLGLAVVLNRAKPGTALMRTAFFAPVVASSVVVAAIWRLMLDPANGLLNGALGLFNIPPQELITSESQALPLIVVMMVWQQVGLTMIIFLGGLQSIPQSLYDAAASDGASGWQQFWRITRPLLSRTTVVAVVVTSVTALQAFAPDYILTGGGPNGSTSLIVYQIYTEAFSLLDPAYASAMSVVLLLVVAVISMFQIRLTRTDWAY